MSVEDYLRRVEIDNGICHAYGWVESELSYRIICRSTKMRDLLGLPSEFREFRKDALYRYALPETPINCGRCIAIINRRERNERRRRTGRTGRRTLRDV